MKKTLKDKLSDKLVNAFLKNKIIAPIPSRFTKKLKEAEKLINEGSISNNYLKESPETNLTNRFVRQKQKSNLSRAPPLD